MVKAERKTRKRRTTTRKNTVVKRTKRTYRKKTGTKVPIMKQLLPQRCLVKLKYVSSIQTSTSATPGTATGRIFKTSLFDPDESGAGHQPYLYDQWAAFYSFARVYGFSYEARINVDSPNYGIFVTFNHTGYTQSVTGDPDYNAEATTCVARRIASFNQGPLIFRGYVNNYKLNGLTKTQFMGDASYESGIGANPAKDSRLNIYASHPATASVTYSLYVTMWLNAELWGMKLQGKS